MSETSTVYVVDDDPAMRDSLRWLLESVDFQVHIFESATAFLDQYKGHRPACLVLDVRMLLWPRFLLATTFTIP